MQFSEWLKQELSKKGWSQSELAKRSNLSPSAVSFLVSGRRNPNPKTCRAIAKALQLPPETVFKAAGALPVHPEQDETIEQIMDLLHRMTADERKEILDYVLWRFARNHKSR